MMKNFAPLSCLLACWLYVGFVISLPFFLEKKHNMSTLISFDVSNIFYSASGGNNCQAACCSPAWDSPDCLAKVCMHWACLSVLAGSVLNILGAAQEKRSRRCCTCFLASEGTGMKKKKKVPVQMLALKISGFPARTKKKKRR